MSSSKKNRVLFSLLCFAISCFNLVFPSLVDLSWIATPNGLARVKTLKKGDKLVSYNFNATNPDDVLVETSATKIEKHFADSVFNIYMPGNRCICVSPQQIVFAVKRIADQEFDARFDIELVQSQYLTTDHMLIDINMNLIPIVEIGKITLFEEKKIKKTILFFFTKRKTVVTKFEPIDMYSVEAAEPHILLIPACSYGVKPQDDPDLPLILIHNGAAALSFGFAFGASAASVSFTEATVSVCGLSFALGPAGLAVGATAGVGYFLYNIFSNNKDKLYLEKSDQNYSSDGNNKKDPKNKKDRKFPPPPPLGNKNDKDKAVELGSKTGYQFKKGADVDLRGSEKTFDDSLNEAFNKTGTPKSEFEVIEWGKDAQGKSFPVEWQAKNGAKVNIDIGHSVDGPDVPHIGYQTGGKRLQSGRIRGHIMVDDVPVNRS
jgi:hypothetical protein